jgi:hypothetical protein
MALFFKNLVVLIKLVIFSSFVSAVWDFLYFPLEEFVDSILLPTLTLIVIYFRNRKKGNRLFTVFYFFLFYLISYYLVICLFYDLRWFRVGGLWNLIGVILYSLPFVVMHLLFLFITKIRNLLKQLKHEIPI